MTTGVPKPTVTFKEVMEIDMGSPDEVHVSDLRKTLQQKGIGDGHSWAIASVFALADPEQALDDMELGAENFVGVYPIHCLWCRTEYRSEIRYNKCAGIA